MKPLYNFSRSFSTKMDMLNKINQRYEMERRYKSLDHQKLIYSLYSLEHKFKYISKDKTNDIQNIIVELDALTMSLAKFQDCGKSVDTLYENLHEQLIKSSLKKQ